MRRNARRAHNRDLTTARELPQPDQRTDQRRQRQQRSRLLRQVQQHENEGIRRRITADADVILLADEEEQPAEHEKHRHHNGDGSEDRPNDVTVEQPHAGTGR